MDSIILLINKTKDVSIIKIVNLIAILVVLFRFRAFLLWVLNNRDK